MKRAVRRIVVVAAAALVGVGSLSANAPRGSAAGRGTAVAAGGGTAAPHAKATLVTSNPHLHAATAGRTSTGTAASHANAAAAPAKAGAAPVATTHPAAVRHSTVRVVTQSWVPRFDAHAYISAHRGLATVLGLVRDAAGRPEGGVRLALQKPGGRPFAVMARRHITTSAADGTFRMTNVQPGSYRVAASVKRGNRTVKKNVRETLRANEVVKVSVEI